jgi:hypothetical protein
MARPRRRLVPFPVCHPERSVICSGAKITRSRGTLRFVRAAVEDTRSLDSATRPPSGRAAALEMTRLW